MTGITWKWHGVKEFIPGVPARDLTDEEVDVRGVRELVEASPLFEKVMPKKQDEKEIK